MKPFALLLCALSAVLLAGCASPTGILPGTPDSVVRSRLGAPDAVHALPDGRRLEYVLGPYQQEVFMVDLDAAGAVRQVRQVRTAENFARLQPGRDRVADVQREFGTPWKVERYRASGLTAWLYPYLEGSFYSMMAVHVDDRGVVQSVQNGPDPRFLGGGNRPD
ncbi:MAG: hypothetical protein ING40_04520 [Burkholderiales bacterium]|jgi:hypothetical protein|nr:hypothetical protein [Burkholderiales bacterium]MCA3228283.1 hypothetical protein [Burkholderiales bacterium]